MLYLVLYIVHEYNVDRVWEADTLSERLPLEGT